MGDEIAHVGTISTSGEDCMCRLEISSEDTLIFPSLSEAGEYLMLHYKIDRSLL